MPSRKRPSWTERQDVKRRMTMAPPSEDADGPAIASPALPIPSSSDAGTTYRTSPIGGGTMPTYMHPTLSASLNSATSPVTTPPPYTNSATSLPGQSSSANGGIPSQLSRSGRASPPGTLRIPKMPAVTQVALSAMQYLPTPLVVLSGLKTVVFANDAMSRLLGLDLMPEAADEEQGYNATNKLLGQSLGQIGVDLMQDGQPVWVNWDKFLDGLSQRSASRTSQSSTELIIEQDQELKELARAASAKDPEHAPLPSPSAKRKRPEWDEEPEKKRQRDRSYVHDTVVDVILSSQFVGAVSGSRDTKSLLPYRHVQARMIISIWSMEGQQFFTLTFSSQTPETPPHRSQTRMASRTPTGTASSPSASLAVKGFARCAHCGSNADPATPPPRTSPSEIPLSLAPLPLSNSAARPTALQRTLKLKDAILNGMQVPKFAMWKDESVVVPNKAAELLMKRHTDPTSDETLDPLTRFQPWTDDFSRKLEPDENPIVILCRTQESFKNFRVGYYDNTGKRIVYEVSGECLYDDAGEFIGGMTALKDVTDFAMQLQEQNERNEQQFEVICDCMPQIAWTTTPSGGHVDWFSKRWYEYTGLTEEESFGEAWANTFHPDDMTETFKRWNHSLTTGDEYVTEYRARSKTGEWRWMLGRALPLRDSKTGQIIKWFGTCTDIHELVEARQEQKRLHEQLLNVIDHAKVTVWSIDRQKILTFLEGQLAWSPNASEGYRKGLIGQRIEDVFGRQAGGYDLRRYVKAIERILAGDLGEHVSEHHIDGARRWYRTRFVPVIRRKLQASRPEENYVDGVVGVSQDVSEVKMREQELESTEKENIRLLGAENAAKEASRLKSQFLANMSHEIRTPIAGVIGMAELLTDTPLTEDQKDLAENIQRSANGLLTVINDILDLSKVESGRLDIEEVQFSLSVVLRDVGKMMSFAAERKGLVYEQNIRMGREDDLIVLGDPGRCRQILTNLLTNSIKFTSEGSVTMSAWVKAETNDNVTVSFCVEDTGIGIEEEVRKKLFKPFSQADSSTARRFGGTGLGLTICKNLVHLMKGSITLDSVLGQGTKATFTIPFTKLQYRERAEPLVNLGAMPDRFSSELSISGKGSERATPPQTPSEMPRLHGHSLAKKAVSASSGASDLSVLLPLEKRKEVNVLVVEDNQINQTIATRTIKKLGFNVNAVWNGKEALEYLLENTQQGPSTSNGDGRKLPDLILMDVQMPVLDGYRATHQIRYHDPYRKLPGMGNIPIVAMTASAIQGDREKCQKAGMDDYLSKPVNSGTLERMLVKWALRRNQGKISERHEPAAAGSNGHSDHDSNCTENDVVLASIPSFHEATYPQNKPQVKGAPANDQENPADAGHDNGKAHQRSRLADSPSFPDVMSPPAESEGDRGLRRQAAEEKASALRDDKLVQAAQSDEEHHSSSSQAGSTGRVGMRRMHTGNPSDHLRSHSRVDELTEQNLGTMNRERHEAVDSNNDLSRGEGMDEDVHAMFDGNEHRPDGLSRLHEESSGDSLETNAGTFKRPTASRGGAQLGSEDIEVIRKTSASSLRGRLNREHSSTSEKTVTPRNNNAQ